MKIIARRPVNKKKKVKPFVFKSNKELFKNSIEQHNKFKILVYNPEIKTLLRELSKKEKNPGLLEIINKMSKQNYRHKLNSLDSKKISSYRDPIGRFILKIIPNEYNVFGAKSKGNSNFELFELSVKSKGKLKKYFLKEYRDGRIFKDATAELLLLKIMEKEGINIIKPQFAFDNIVNKNKNNSRSFIAYEFSNLHTVEEVVNNRVQGSKLLDSEYRLIRSKINAVRSNFKRKTKIELDDVFINNVFLERGNENIKLYFFDPYTYSSVSQLHNLAKKRGIV
ncbi:MAG: hypothetical protein PHW45_00425 [Candidatus ainarchaeum sp.]|nr:hypothetical protein [Candidatus ainarchaeum sp.]